MRTCLMPVATVAEEELIVAQRFLDERLGPGTRRLAPLALPPEALDTARGQHDAPTILRAALAACPADADRVLVIAEQDLFIPMLTFIFGQAQLDGTAALVSVARLHQEFYGLPPRRDLARERLRKEILHELGHTFGLTHCADSRCAMALSINIAGIDAKRDELCRDCALPFTEKLDSLRRNAGATKE